MADQTNYDRWAARQAQSKLARDQEKVRAAVVTQSQQPAAPILDRLGRPLVEGAGVIFDPHPPAIYTIKSIVPDLSPQAKPGIVRVSLITEIVLPVMAGKAVQEFALAYYPAPPEADGDALKAVEADQAAQSAEALSTEDPKEPT